MIRLFDLFFSFIGVLIASPFLLFIAIAIKLTSRGPVIFSQKRVGKNNNYFNVFKFRTMIINSDKKSLITIGGRDSRITKIGFFLRKYKLDELPQLVNVLVGQMSLVGPRPEVRKYVNLYSESQLKVLNIRPGITDWASIMFRNENDLLEKSSDPELYYINSIVPEKILLNQRYVAKYNVAEYFKILGITILVIVYPRYISKLLANSY